MQEWVGNGWMSDEQWEEIKEKIFAQGKAFEALVDDFDHLPEAAFADLRPPEDGTQRWTLFVSFYRKPSNNADNVAAGNAG